jgi:hypothetical protein
VPEKKVITIYQSFEDMDTVRSQYAAAIDPVEGLRRTVELILRTYGTTKADLNKQHRNVKLTITKSE